jgi:recombination protein RecA
VEFDIIYGHGISRGGGLLDVGTELGAITKSGAFFTYGDHRLGQGRENARQFLEENTDIAAALEADIRKKLKRVPEEASGDEEEE